MARKDTSCIQLILVSIYILYLKLLLDYMVVLRWTTNTIVPDSGGGPDLLLSGLLPWIFVVINHNTSGILFKILIDDFGAVM